MTTAAGSWSTLADLLRVVIALCAVIGLAWLSLRALAARGYGRGFRAVDAGPHALQVLQSVPLDARRSLWLVRAGERVLLLGVGDGGAPRLIAELDSEATAAPVHEAVPEPGVEGAVDSERALPKVGAGERA